MGDAMIHSLQVGLPTTYGTKEADHPYDRPWETGFFKRSTGEPVMLRRLNLDGDGQADRTHHGGLDKAVCVYPLAHYRYWSGRLERPLPAAAFGENFTVTGQAEHDVCIGDVYRVGDALVQITQPRSPCWKLARRWRVPELARWVQQTGLTGWYLRVLEEGIVQAGQRLTLEERLYPEWTVAAANATRYGRPFDRDGAARLAACPPLSESWTETMRRIAHAERLPDDRKRLVGKNEP